MSQPPINRFGPSRIPKPQPPLSEPSERRVTRSSSFAESHAVRDPQHSDTPQSRLLDLLMDSAFKASLSGYTDEGSDWLIPAACTTPRASHAVHGVHDIDDVFEDATECLPPDSLGESSAPTTGDPSSIISSGPHFPISKAASRRGSASTSTWGLGWLACKVLSVLLTALGDAAALLFPTTVSLQENIRIGHIAHAGPIRSLAEDFESVAVSLSNKDDDACAVCDELSSDDDYASVCSDGAQATHQIQRREAACDVHGMAISEHGDDQYDVLIPSCSLNLHSVEPDHGLESGRSCESATSATLESYLTASLQRGKEIGGWLTDTEGTVDVLL
jgi:hypothetical protein